MKFFMDTGFLIALANKKDKYHQITVERYEEIIETENFRFISSEHVLSEFLSFVMYKLSHDDAVTWGEEFFENGNFHIEYSNTEILKHSWDRFKKDVSERKPFSFVDCVILETCKIINPDYLLSYDKRLNIIFDNIKLV